ncbi:SH3-binding, glutamic acid-rich protein [Dictyocaulus viviparus]|uniref:SH3-binding, glutamic acid-rich protein n=1 Tax=Dictyocaulus viviparus TaxID=29172 RepID=A0A0D8XPY3_DICVI|nr:SH3-binding, glutamic acid-rich protein [Dictyocaulus viviparus]
MKIIHSYVLVQIRKRVQRTLMILDSMSIPFDIIDITKPEKKMFSLSVGSTEISENYSKTHNLRNIRKRVQRTLMILDSMSIPFDIIDITKPGNEEQRQFMREHAVKGDSKEIPLPPQFFYNDEYLGNFVDFEEALEDDRIADFFRLLPNERRANPNIENKENHVEQGESHYDECIQIFMKDLEPVASSEKKKEVRQIGQEGKWVNGYNRRRMRRLR